MTGTEQYRTILIFLSLYLVLSWVPFLYLNREVLDEVVKSVAVTEPLTAVWVVGALVVVGGLLRAQEGVERYNQFLSAPRNVVAFLVALSFVVAAVSWWAVPEAVFYFELDVTLNEALVLILLCQAPMLVFLSLMTVLGRAMSPK